MDYIITTTGERVRLDVLANADKSIIGLQIGNCRIISIRYSDFLNLVVLVLGEREINNCELTLFKYHVLPDKNKNKDEDDTIVVMETVGDCLDTNPIWDALKLYQASDVFSCYMFSYRCVEGALRGGGIGRVYLREHAIYWPPKTYKMTDEDKVEFKPWFEAHRKLFIANQNDIFRKMKQLYFDSYLTDDANQSFIMLTVILEMIFGASGELKYRISRGAGVFLSSSKNEMKEIVKLVKNLYNARSKYVHEGKSVSYKELFELRELVRKIVVLMYEQGMHKPEFDFKAFSDEITYQGYLKE